MSCDSALIIGASPLTEDWEVFGGTCRRGATGGAPICDIFGATSVELLPMTF